MESHSNNRKKPTKLEDLSKEQIREAILKKRQCSVKAQKIVESLLEACVSVDFFLQCLPEINQSHLDDVIQERSIIHLCGYPLCRNVLLEKDIPKQKYKISIKTNKVYDITERKCFCSNLCYKSATFIKKQMLTSPLWFREYEDIPTFQLFNDSSGCVGQEVDVSFIEKIVHKDSITNQQVLNKKQIEDLQPNNSRNSSISIFNGELRNDTVENTSEVSKHENISETSRHTKANEIAKPENETFKQKNQKNLKAKINSSNIVGEIIEKPEKKIDPILTQKQSTPKKTPSKDEISKKSTLTASSISIQVERCLAEWFTLDTMLFIFGEEKIKSMVSDKGECINTYMSNHSNSLFHNSNSYDHYQQLCRRLNMLELEDKQNDAQTLKRELRPLPDYSILQKESNTMQLKVRAFLTGQTEIAKSDENNQTEVKIRKNSNRTILPLVDKNAQNALRRRIICEHLNKTLPDLLRSLGLLSVSITSDVRLLVNTFKLKANNIMFKPVQWTLITIVIIKLLSLRDPRLQYLLEQPIAYQHLQLLLLSFKQDGGYLERLVSWITDIDRLLEMYNTQLTIE